MGRRMIINDLKSNRLVSAATFAFMALTALLFGLSVFLFGNLADSIDNLMTTARTPDFLQMHAGELDERELAAFSGQEDDVEEMQICTFLNLPNSQLSIGSKSLVNNMQDNGLCCQSELFDYLVDADNNVIHPSEGEVYVPVCYKKEYDIKTGEIMKIGSEELLVAGFLRDSQMNSMMASSKRFLVSERDYNRIRPLGSEEYLIEFRLKAGSDVNAFATSYKDAGMPDNGPAITFSLIRMINALSDGMMILVILLTSIVVLLISIICIRYIILIQLEKDIQKIGMLKAVGISRRGIRKLYFSKYLILSALGCFAGVLVASGSGKLLSVHMRELYGNAGNSLQISAFMILGSLAAEGIILLSVYLNIRKTDKMSPVESLYGINSHSKKNLWLPATVITAAAVFMILVPCNIRTTLKAPEFVTYMGIGESQIRIDIRQTENVEKKAAIITEEIQKDSRVSAYALMQTGSYKSLLPDGASYNLMIEKGDHSKFPIRYTQGSYPENNSEIALSILNAQEMSLKLGDKITVSEERIDGSMTEKTCTVCGIYSDITNGGKTAKACLNDPADETPVMWSILYLSLADEYSAGEWVNEYQGRYRSFGDSVKVTMITDYLMGTYGQTIRDISKAAYLSGTMSCVILFIVVLLLLRLVIWKERSDSSLKKALGFTTSDIRKEYFKKTLLYTLPGILGGVFAGIVLGQGLTEMLLRSMGVYSFHFVLEPALVFAAVPAVTLFVVMAAAQFGLLEVKRISAFECLCAGRLQQ